MKRFLVSVILVLAATFHGRAATTPIYINTSPVFAPPDVPPQIDASVFVNQSTFSISDAFSLTPLPYQTLNTKFFTNRPSGAMFGIPGFRFDFFTNNTRKMMDTWVNNGSISVSSPVTFVLSGVSAVPEGNFLLVAATNIISTGPLNAGDISLLRLEGKNIDLRRNGIRTGPTLTNNLFFFGGGYLGLSNYFNDFGVTDVYWGTGTNNMLNNRGTPMPLNGFSPNFTLPFPQSAQHQVIDSTFLIGSLFTNIVTVPSFSFGFYGAHVFTNQNGPNSFSIQVVFVPTNSFDTNFSTDVRFTPDVDNGATVTVGFNSADFDIVTQTYLTNSVYLADALAGETNTFLARNQGATTRRPSTYEVTRLPPFSLGFGSLPGNATYDPTLLYRPSYFSNSVRVLYAGYSAFISSLSSSPLLGGGALADPTNFPGRVEILGDKVNLDRTRIRAESTLIIKARDLTSNRVAQVDAPYVNLDLGSVEPELVISNVAPQAVRRLSGFVSAWSAVWRNFELSGTGATNTIDFHVLIVEPNLQSLQPVVINELALHGNNLRLSDQLNVGRKILLDAEGLHVTGGLSFPFSSALAATNVQRVVNFTNDGTVFVSGAANYGTDRPAPYSNFINHGTNSAAAQLIRTLNFENSGSLIANGGVISIDAVTARFNGPPVALITNIFTNFFFDIFGNFTTNFFTNIVAVGGKLESVSDIDIRAGTLTLSNTLFFAGSGAQGSLLLNVTNRLTDAGPTATNNWVVTAGFNAFRRPTISDLLGTHITTRTARFGEAVHIWAGQDRGAVADGYTNNLALGKLILDGGDSSLFRFAGLSPTSMNGLYVDYIELQNSATNFDNPDIIAIDPSLTIYFAAASVPAEKLDGAGAGRFRWVSSFAGPNSSTNITYPSGTNYTFNIALVQSKDIDSDGDGIVNAIDPTPIFVENDIELTIAMSHAPIPAAVLSWNALGLAMNYLEVKTSFAGDAWQTVTNFMQGAATGRVTVQDPIAGAGLRIYRVRVE